MTAGTIHVAGREIPLVLPNRRDARLHTAAVIISIHVIGITALGFRVSVPQILSAIVTAGLIDVALTLRRSGAVVWPASGMLTGSGVALILRMTGMGAHEYWSWEGWYLFAAVAGFSILTKYVIRWRGDHIFNPSNVGLVVAFLILDPRTIEPLDFWWGPWGPWMFVVYVLIIGGGILITRRLHLLEMALTYWGMFAVALGVLAVSGHCMTTQWSPTPVCDGRFWTVLVTSPEVLIFLFFMITDPRTIPSGRAARVVFAATLAVAGVLMIAPHSMEFGAKVGLLASLAIWSPLRRLFERVLPAVSTEQAGPAELVQRLSTRPAPAAFGVGAMIGIIAGLSGLAIVAAGGPARVAEASPIGQPFTVEVDASAVPEVVVDPTVERIDVDTGVDFARTLSLDLARNLGVEAEATRRADSEMLRSADDGSRLAEMQARIDDAITLGTRESDEFVFESLFLTVDEDATGQSGAVLAFEGRGDVTRVEYDESGVEIGTTIEEFHSLFAMRQSPDGRWLIVAVRPLG
jgi:hypothetical protein